MTRFRGRGGPAWFSGLSELLGTQGVDAESAQVFRARQREAVRPVLVVVLLAAAGFALVMGAGDSWILVGAYPFELLATRAVFALLFALLAVLAVLRRGEARFNLLLVAATLTAAGAIALIARALPPTWPFRLLAAPVVSLAHIAVVPYFRAYLVPALALLVVLNADLWLDPTARGLDLLLLNAYLLPTVALAGVICLVLSRQRERLFLLERALEASARTDPLTGLANRRAFEERYREDEARRARRASPSSLLVLDLDHFKAVNDRYGHLVGDAVLREVAERTAASLRELDVAARFGGEEFVVLLPETEASEAGRVAERVRDRVAGTPIPAAGVRLSITVSLGCTEIRPGEELEEAFGRADAALYRAKEAGRNRVEAA